MFYPGINKVLILFIIVKETNNASHLNNDQNLLKPDVK